MINLSLSPSHSLSMIHCEPCQPIRVTYQTAAPSRRGTNTSVCLRLRPSPLQPHPASGKGRLPLTQLIVHCCLPHARTHSSDAPKYTTKQYIQLQRCCCICFHQHSRYHYRHQYCATKTKRLIKVDRSIDGGLCVSDTRVQIIITRSSQKTKRLINTHTYARTQAPSSHVIKDTRRSRHAVIGNVVQAFFDLDQ